jgi:transposase
VRRGEIDLVYRGGPDAVAAVIAAQAARIDELIARVEELERQIGRSSRNSSLPPSRDSPDARKTRPKRQGSGRSQGGQPGHRGQQRPMVACPDRVETYWPSECDGCGALVAEADRVADGDPVAHQVSDITVVVKVCEHRRMRTRCSCGHRTLAPLPAGVPEGAFGASVAAAAATLTAARVSRRETSRLLEDLCGIRVGVASVEMLVKQASAALEEPYVRILEHLDQAAVRCADETSWRQAGDSRWLSVAAAVDAALFQIATRRDRDATRALLGDDPGGVIVSDRYAVYLYIDASKRQLCLAHVLRDFVALGERAGVPGRLGRKLERCLAEAFKILNQAGRDPADLPALAIDLAPSREQLRELLKQGARGRDAQTARFCTGLLDRYDALWTFTRIPGVPATNNTAERALRHGVLWRKTSYGTQTEHGNRAVERLLTIRETCRLQRRRLHTYLAEAITAHQHGQPVPTPLQA